MKIIKSLTAYTTVFILVVIVLFAVLMIGLIIYRKKSKGLIVEEEAPEDRRYGDVDSMVDVEDIADDMIIEKGRKGPGRNDPGTPEGLQPDEVCFLRHPFTPPITMPLTKPFCRKG